MNISLSHSIASYWKIIFLQFFDNIFVLEYTVPGDPQDVKTSPVNSTTINVVWKPPQEKDRNGIIRGYHIHVQETREEVSSYVCFVYHRKIHIKVRLSESVTLKSHLSNPLLQVLIHINRTKYF